MSEEPRKITTEERATLERAVREHIANPPKIQRQTETGYREVDWIQDAETVLPFLVSGSEQEANVPKIQDYYQRKYPTPGEATDKWATLSRAIAFYCNHRHELDVADLSDLGDHETGDCPDPRLLAQLHRWFVLMPGPPRDPPIDVFLRMMRGEE